MTEKSTRKPMKDEESNPTITCASNKSLAEAADREEGGKYGSRRHRKQRQLLAELLSELESSTDDEEEFKQEGKEEKPSSSGTDEEIIKELHNIKKQNTITHYLLTASILVTLAWQLSEISLIFKIRQGLNNPLKSIVGAIKGLLPSSRSSENNANQDSSQKQTQIISPTYLPGLKIPDLSHLDLPGFDTSNDDDD